MKAVFSYIVVLFSAMTYAVLFDRNAGSIMTVFLIVVPVVSVFLTVYASRKMNFEFVTDENILKKNCRSTFSIHVSKDTFLPLPVISFELTVSEHFRRPEFDIYRFSMSENRDISIDIELVPEVCGNAVVSLGKYYITDYLGIFRFRIRTSEISENIIIMPEIREADDYGGIIHSIYATLPDNDDENSSVYVSGRTAVPGYEYRSYVPGDSLKKINWKLSSKRNELFVRKDESGGITLPNIILDITQFGEDRKKRSGLSVLEQITEGALSLLNECIKNGIECVFVYPRSGIMHTESVTSYDDIERISGEIFRYMDNPGNICLQHDETSKSSEVNIVYAAGVSEELAGKAEASVTGGNSVKVVIPEQVYGADTVPVTELWLQRDDFSLNRVI